VLIKPALTSILYWSSTKPWISRTVIPRAYIAINLLIETFKALPSFGDQQWLKAAAPIPGNFDFHRSVFPNHWLLAVAVAMVLDPLERFAFGVANMMGQFSSRGLLNNTLL
jgi:hypothetical protein